MFRYSVFGLAATVALSVGSAQPSDAQSITAGTYVMNQGGNCATLILRGAGPQGNEYSWDPGCDGRNVYTAQSVRVTRQGIQVDGGRMVINSVNANSMNVDFILGSNRSRGLVYRRQ